MGIGKAGRPDKGRPAPARGRGAGEPTAVKLECGTDCWVDIWHSAGERRVKCPKHGGSWVVHAEIVRSVSVHVRPAPPEMT